MIMFWLMLFIILRLPSVNKLMDWFIDRCRTSSASVHLGNPTRINRGGKLSDWVLKISQLLQFFEAIQSVQIYYVLIKQNSDV